MRFKHNKRYDDSRGPAKPVLSKEGVMRFIYDVKYKCKICGIIKRNCRIEPAKYVDPEIIIVGLKMFGMWREICDNCRAKNQIKKFKRIRAQVEEVKDEGQVGT